MSIKAFFYLFQLFILIFCQRQFCLKSIRDELFLQLPTIIRFFVAMSPDRNDYLVSQLEFVAQAQRNKWFLIKNHLSCLRYQYNWGSPTDIFFLQYSQLVPLKIHWFVLCQFCYQVCHIHNVIFPPKMTYHLMCPKVLSRCGLKFSLGFGLVGVFGELSKIHPIDNNKFQCSIQNLLSSFFFCGL